MSQTNRRVAGAERKGMTRAEKYAEANADMMRLLGVSLRTFQRVSRALKSEFAAVAHAGELKPGTIDKILSDPVRLERARAILAKATPTEPAATEAT